jgi:hypothetical protein
MELVTNVVQGSLYVPVFFTTVYLYKVLKYIYKQVYTVDRKLQTQLIYSCILL